MGVEELLKEAAMEARDGVSCGDGGPFGAIITDMEGNIISRAHNMVLATKNPINHAEVVAITKACQKLGTNDLSQCILYSSCEPCPMCLGAIIWSNIKVLYYGATRKDARDAGFRDEAIYQYFASQNKIIEEHESLQEDCCEVLRNYQGGMY